MISFRLAISEDEMIAFFKRHGLTVTEVTWNESLPVYHNRVIEEPVTAMCIVNPHDQKTIPVSVAFEKVIFKVKNSLLLDGIQKLTILEALR